MMKTAGLMSREMLRPMTRSPKQQRQQAVRSKGITQLIDTLTAPSKGISREELEKRAREIASTRVSEPRCLFVSSEVQNESLYLCVCVSV
jgi:hypothetical protein